MGTNKPKITHCHKKSVRKGKINIHDESYIGHNVVIDITSDVTIKKLAYISDGVQIFTHKHYWNHSRKSRREIQKIEPINLVIEEDVYIGPEAIILGIKKIGKGATVGIRSVVTKDILEYEIWSGNPARKTGERVDN